MPTPFDLNEKRWNLTAKFCFSFVTGPIPIYTGSIPGPVRPGTELSVLITFSLSFAPCPHRVHTASSEICNSALKYVWLLWSIYCRSEICIAALKCVLLHQNIYCHFEICYPDSMSNGLGVKITTLGTHDNILITPLLTNMWRHPSWEWCPFYVGRTDIYIYINSYNTSPFNSTRINRTPA